MALLSPFARVQTYALPNRSAPACVLASTSEDANGL